MARLSKKPRGESRLVMVFDCDECGQENTVYENYEDFSDCGDGDSLDHNCPHCNSYFKKIGTVIKHCKIKETYFESLK